MVERIKSGGLVGGHDTKLKKILNDMTLQAHNENQKTRTAMYASDYGACMKKVYLSFFPELYPPTGLIEPRQARVFHNGNDVHERLGGYLKREPNIDFHDEVDVPRDDLDVHGRCDGTCVLDEAALVVEFKSINKDDVHEAKSEHIGQLTFYLDMFRRLKIKLKENMGLKEDDFVDEEMIKEHEIETGIEFTRVEKWLLTSQGDLRGEIIYESKPNNELFCFPVPYQADEAKKVRLWFEQLKWHIDNKEVPKVHYDKARFPCSWGSDWKGNKGRCPFYNVCWGSDDEVPEADRE